MIKIPFEGKMMNVITQKLRYIPASEDPLSADVYFIEGDHCCYIYDVGNNAHSLHQINQTAKEKSVILSHYHKDHTGNIAQIHCRDLYVGKKTYEMIGKGMIVEDILTICDGIKIEIMHCPSVHTDGSLIANIDHMHTLIGDLYFTRHPFDKEKAMKMIEFLTGIDTKYFVISHREDDKVVLKETLIAELQDYFGL